MTLNRREFLKRLGLTGGGAVALALAGCGEDDAIPPRPAQPDAPATPVQSEQPPVQQQITEDPQPTEAVQQTDQAVDEQPVPEVEQQAASQQADTQAQPAQQSQGSQPEPRVERRLLVPGVNTEGYELEDPSFDPVAGARGDYGEIDGAGYRIELPEQWNGELVLWAHGFRGLNEEGTGFSRRLTFDDIPARDLIIGQGYGWATSTFRANGYVPGVGVDDLLRVKDRVAEIARPARRTYIAGASMGGATAQLMAQEFPEEIAAALALCPAMGNVWVVDYTIAWHALAHWLIGEMPREFNILGMLNWASALGTSDEAGLSLTPLGEQFAALIKDFTGGERWGVDEGLQRQWNIAFSLGVTFWPQIVGVGDPPAGAVVSVANDMPPADTREHIYGADPSAGIDLQRLNEEVFRLAADPDRRHDPGVGIPTGELQVPMLAIKTTGDLFTPIHLDRDYQKLVNEAGWSQNLVNQPIRRAGHCAFSDAEALRAFTSVITWLSLGFTPAGDDLQGDLAAIGTRFTDPFDEDDPLRPTG